MAFVCPTTCVNLLLGARVLPNACIDRHPRILVPRDTKTMLLRGLKAIVIVFAQIGWPVRLSTQDLQPSHVGSARDGLAP